MFQFIEVSISIGSYTEIISCYSIGTFWPESLILRPENLVQELKCSKYFWFGLKCSNAHTTSFQIGNFQNMFGPRTRTSRLLAADKFKICLDTKP